MANVLLVHGLWRTPICMLGLGRRLRGAGFAARQFGYVTVAESYERIVLRLLGQIERIAGEPYAVVGYSLGGLLLRAAIAEVSTPPAHLIMLGTPNRPPLLARRLTAFSAFRLAVGESGSKLGEEAYYRDLPLPGVPYTIVAGTRGPIGRLSPFGDQPNDGLVAVAETRIRDDDVPIEVPVTHAFLPNSSTVQRIVTETLSHAFASAQPGREPARTA